MNLLIKGLFESIISQLKFRNLLLLVIPLCILALLLFGRADKDADTAMNGNVTSGSMTTITNVDPGVSEQNAQQVIISDAALGAEANQPIEQSDSDASSVLAPQTEIEVNRDLADSSAQSNSAGSSLEPSVTLLNTATNTAADRATDAREVDRIVIPAIDLDTSVTELGWHTATDEAGEIFSEWDFADNAAGWHINSARPGDGGNVVMSGHNNIMGAVFRELDQLDQGDEAFVYIGDQVYTYEIDRVMVVPEVYADAEQRFDNAKWIQQFDDDRITLVSCWPRDDNSHRIIVIGHAVKS